MQDRSDLLLAVAQVLHVNGQSTDETLAAVERLGRAFGQPARIIPRWAWFGALAIIAGVLLASAGLLRYRQTRPQLESGKFEPAGFVLDLVGILTALFGLVLAGYLIYIEARPW